MAEETSSGCFLVDHNGLGIPPLPPFVKNWEMEEKWIKKDHIRMNDKEEEKGEERKSMSKKVLVVREKL